MWLQFIDRQKWSDIQVATVVNAGDFNVFAGFGR